MNPSLNPQTSQQQPPKPQHVPPPPPQGHVNTNANYNNRPVPGVQPPRMPTQSNGVPVMPQQNIRAPQYFTNMQPGQQGFSPYPQTYGQFYPYMNQMNQPPQQMVQQPSAPTVSTLNKTPTPTLQQRSNFSPHQVNTPPKQQVKKAQPSPKPIPQTAPPRPMGNNTQTSPGRQQPQPKRTPPPPPRPQQFNVHRQQQQLSQHAAFSNQPVFSNQSEMEDFFGDDDEKKPKLVRLPNTVTPRQIAAQVTKTHKKSDSDSSSSDSDSSGGYSPTTFTPSSSESDEESQEPKRRTRQTTRKSAVTGEFEDDPQDQDYTFRDEMEEDDEEEEDEEYDDRMQLSKPKRSTPSKNNAAAQRRAVALTNRKFTHGVVETSIFADVDEQRKKQKRKQPDQMSDDDNDDEWAPGSKKSNAYVSIFYTINK